MTRARSEGIEEKGDDGSSLLHGGGGGGGDWQMEVLVAVFKVPDRRSQKLMGGRERDEDGSWVR